MSLRYNWMYVSVRRLWREGSPPTQDPDLPKSGSRDQVVPFVPPPCPFRAAVV